MSRDKGKRYERELASKFREYGYDAHRTSQYCGNTGDASDVVGLPGIHIEAKHQEKIQIYDWMSQAIHDSAKSGNKPTVFFRKNNAETLVCMRFDDWMEIYREWQSEKELLCGECDGDCDCCDTARELDAIELKAVRINVSEDKNESNGI